MPAERLSTTVALRRLRVDASESTGAIAWGPAPALVVAGVIAGFVLVGAGNLDPGPTDARVGLAAQEALGPLGKVYGGWAPDLWPLTVAASRLWALGEGGWPTPASIRWPGALAAFVLGCLVVRRVGRVLGTRAALLAGVALCGSLALVDRSEYAGIEPIAALMVVAALDRLVGRGLGWGAGLWAAAGFLAGGWPPVLVIALAALVLGQLGPGRLRRLALPVLAAAVGWSAWALAVAPAQAWAAALTLPLTKAPAWWLVPGTVLLALPLGPFAAMAGWASVRDAWPAPGRDLVLGWLRVAGVGALAGTLVPGLAPAGTMAMLAGLAVAAAAGLERVAAGELSRGARRMFLALALGVAGLWGVIAVVQGGYLAAAVSYYRPLAIVMFLTGTVIAIVALGAAWCGGTRWALGALLATAVMVKVVHWGYYVPEWNYRFSQGPWGRAVGQWVPPRWPIYTLINWPEDLAFATEHPVRRLARAESLRFLPPDRRRYLLLAGPEFDHWPATAPKVVKVRDFRDEYGGRRVLVHTRADVRQSRLETGGTLAGR